jgi:hypothetical protein
MVTWRCFLALNGADPERTCNGCDTHGDALLIGCLLALLVRRNPDPTIKLSGMWIVAGGGLLAILFLLPHRTVLHGHSSIPSISLANLAHRKSQKKVGAEAAFGRSFCLAA